MLNKKHKKTTNALMLDNFVNDQSSEVARLRDKERASLVKSPDLSKMHRYNVGKTTYFFNSKKKLETFKQKHK